MVCWILVISAVLVATEARFSVNGGCFVFYSVCLFVCLFVCLLTSIDISRKQLPDNLEFKPSLDLFLYCMLVTFTWAVCPGC